MTRAGCLGILAAMLFAGCVAGTPSAELQRTDDPVAAPTFDDTTGAIRGTVTDDAIAPLNGVLVLMEDGVSVMTAEDGSFGISNVAPGVRALTFAVVGFQEAHSEVEVVAGELSTVRVLLVSASVAAPYVETIVAEARLTCAFMYQGPAPPPADYANMGCNWVTLVAGPNPVDQDGTEFLVMPFHDVVGVWMETSWTPASAAAVEAEMLWLAAIEGQGPTTSGTALAYARGESPATASVTRDAIDEAVSDALGVACGDESCRILASHRAYRATDGLTLVLDQRYTDYLSVFHGGSFPDSFSALADS